MAGPSDNRLTAAAAIRPAQASDWSFATAWLAAAGLPTADLKAAHMQDFLLATAAGQPVGMIGLECYANCGLLRSLVVDEMKRGAGLGARLVAELEALAYRRGLRGLWLLTIDADPFFARHGYTVRQRDEAPQDIRDSAEFSSLCPGDAVLMYKALAPG